MHNIGRFRIIRRPAFPVISEIYEGFYLGGFPAFVRFDTTLYCPTKLKTMKSGKQDGNSVKYITLIMFSSVITHSPFTSIVDVTCELPQLHSFGNYLNIPTWDGTAPTLAEIDKAVDWIIAERSAGRGVLIHCWYQFLSVACF